MGKMAAVVKAHTHNGIAGLKQGKINGRVCLRARMRLHIGVTRAEKFARSFDRDIFNDINILAAAVITLAGQTLGILIGEHTAHCRHDLRRNKVFRGDQFNIFPLALQFKLHGVCNFRIGLRHLGYGIIVIGIHNLISPLVKIIH